MGSIRTLFGIKSVPDDQPIDEELLPREMPEDVTMHKVPAKRPIHESLLAEMEHKRRQLLQQDAAIVEEINTKQEELASTRMALRAVEDMMRSVRDNPLTPPVIKSVTEMRKTPEPKQEYQQQASRLHRPGQQVNLVEVTIDQDALETEMEERLIEQGLATGELKATN